MLLFIYGIVYVYRKEIAYLLSCCLTIDSYFGGGDGNERLSYSGGLSIRSEYRVTSDLLPVIEHTHYVAQLKIKSVISCISSSPVYVIH